MPKTTKMSRVEFLELITRRGETPKRHKPIKLMKGVKRQPTFEEWMQATGSYNDPTQELTAHLKSQHVKRLQIAGPSSMCSWPTRVCCATNAIMC